jgi:hypothetical protein
MKRWFTGTCAAALALSLSAGLGAIPAAQAQTATLSSGAHPGQQAHGAFTVELTKDLNSKKLKEGDPVEAKLTGSITLPNGSVVPRGARVTGHVTQAKARSNHDSDSALGIVFDKIAWSGNEGTSVKGVVEAAAPNPNAQTGDAGLADGYNNLKDVTTKSVAAPPPSQQVPVLNSDSKGVLGMKNLQLNDSVFTSSGKEVKLDSGTRMLLDVSMQ